jgi:hypothetical protein
VQSRDEKKTPVPVTPLPCFTTHASPRTVQSSTVRNTPVSTRRCGRSTTFVVDELGHGDGCGGMTMREEGTIPARVGLQSTIERNSSENISKRVDGYAPESLTQCKNSNPSPCCNGTRMVAGKYERVGKPFHPQLSISPRDDSCLTAGGGTACQCGRRNKGGKGASRSGGSRGRVVCFSIT